MAPLMKIGGLFKRKNRESDNEFGPMDYFPHLDDFKKAFLTNDAISKPVIALMIPDIEVFEVSEIQDLYRKVCYHIVEFGKLRLVADRVLTSFKIVDKEKPVYHSGLDYLVLNANKTKSLTAGKCRQLLKILEIIRELWETGRKMEIRSLNYCLPDLHVSNTTVGDYTNDVAMMLKCPRDNLQLSSLSRGWIIGRVIFWYCNEKYNCSKSRVEGKPIPPQPSKVRFCDTTDALFVLYVEKHSVFSWLIQSGFHKKYPCIIITGCGHPSVATKGFVHLLTEHFKKPLYVLVDCNFGGFKIVCTLTYGSLSLAFDSRNLSVIDVRWVALRPSQLNELNLVVKKGKVRSQTETDNIDKWLNIEQLRARPAWRNELQIMHSSKVDYDIEALHSKGLEFFLDKFLPEKLEEGKWE